MYDLLKLEGNVFQYHSETQGGRSEAKEHLLDERDELWLKLRHEHFASAASQITRNLDEFRTKHKAANYKGAGDGSGLDMRGMRSLVQSLPQYRYKRFYTGNKSSSNSSSRKNNAHIPVITTVSTTIPVLLLILLFVIKATFLSNFYWGNCYHCHHT